jgi:hypothetical protein
MAEMKAEGETIRNAWGRHGYKWFIGNKGKKVVGENKEREEGDIYLLIYILLNIIEHSIFIKVLPNKTNERNQQKVRNDHRISVPFIFVVRAAFCTGPLSRIIVKNVGHLC